MLDILRQRLSEEEREQYDSYDGRASLASHFLVWPGILAIAFYYSGMLNTALIFAIVAGLALPIMLIMARRARGMRELAEERYEAVVRAREREHDEQKSRN